MPETNPFLVAQSQAEASAPQSINPFLHPDVEIKPKGGFSKAAAATRVIAPIAASVIGSIVAPGVGTVVGGGLGGAIGELVAEELEEYAGLRSGKNIKRVGLETALGALPLLGRFAGVKSLLGRTFLRAAQGSGVSVGATAATELVESGELPTGEEIATAAGLGTVFGGLGGLIEGKHLQRMAPKLAAETTTHARTQPKPKAVVPPGAVRPIEIEELSTLKPSSEALPAGTQVRQFFETLSDSGKLAKEVESDPRFQAAKLYVQQTNKEQLEEAASEINRDMTGAILKTVTEQNKTGVDIARGQLLLIKLQQEGRFGEAVDVAVKVTRDLTEAGRTVQAASIWDRLSPQGILIYAQKQAAKSGIKLPADAAEKMVKDAERIASMSPGREKDIARLQLIQGIQDLTPASVRDKALEAWKAMLLTGVKTHVVNTVSNSVSLMLRQVERAVSSGLDPIVGKAQGRSREILFSELFDATAGMWHGAKDGVRRALDAFVYEQPLGMEELRTRAIRGSLGRAVRIPFRFLTAMDTFFKSVVDGGERYRQAWRMASREGYQGEDFKLRVSELVLSPTSEMMERIEAEKLYAVFQKPLGSLGTVGAKLLQKSAALQVIVPFYTTPINIVKYGLERTPLGLMRTLYRTARGEVIGSDLSEELAKGVMGSMIGGMVVAYAKEGLITGGGPADPDARRAMRQAGWQPYSIRLGDQYIAYGRIEPLATVMGLAADYSDLADILNREDAAKNIGFLISQNLLNKTMMRGLSDVVSAINDPERFGTIWLQRLEGTVVPTLVKDLAQTADPTLRRPAGGLESVQSRIPGLTKEVPPLRGLWGKPVVIHSTGPERLASPFYRSNIIHDPATEEIVRIGRETGKWPSSPQRTLGRFPIQQAAYDHYVEEAGAEAHRRLSNLVRSPLYRASPSEKQAAMILDAFADARRLTRDRLGITAQKKASVLFPSSKSRGLSFSLQ